MAASLACTLFSCGEDGVLPEPEPPVIGPGDKDEPDEKPDKNTVRYYCIATTDVADQRNHRGIHAGT